MGLKSLANKVMKLYERAAGKFGRHRSKGGNRLLALPAAASVLPFLNNKHMEGKKGLNGHGRAEDDDEVWRRTIMMGEKCQPLEFSGVIFYDGEGQRVASAPRSPLRGKHTFMLSSPRLS